jgi:hypothetical protein
MRCNDGHAAAAQGVACSCRAASAGMRARKARPRSSVERKRRGDADERRCRFADTCLGDD